MPKKLSINIIFSKEYPEEVFEEMKKNLVESQNVPESMKKIYSSFDPNVECDVTYE